MVLNDVPQFIFVPSYLEEILVRYGTMVTVPLCHIEVLNFLPFEKDCILSIIIKNKSSKKIVLSSLTDENMLTSVISPDEKLKVPVDQLYDPAKIQVGMSASSTKEKPEIKQYTVKPRECPYDITTCCHESVSSLMKFLDEIKLCLEPDCFVKVHEIDGAPSITVRTPTISLRYLAEYIMVLHLKKGFSGLGMSTCSPCPTGNLKKSVSKAKKKLSKYQ